ncbi:uncharacterized protein BX664DRAFT_323481 [Halteromyces radiatus]|uniref:uncharacterized protein n=1 Tax=Halteromyces radiatus TaxID=101107 RepID=UPI00221FB9A2|nr:uncharacterized protein BX664DRAFT_323481 [Halteromyces radiatus]KAI8096257.1 hypothetical protein BX664DRAFT_323481 [Halteromyces radiatus]
MYDMYIGTSPPGTPHSLHSYHGDLTPSTIYGSSQVHRTTGESLSCLVGASLTTVGNTVYVLGGFDRYSDEVFNTLYQLTVDEGQQQTSYCWTRMAYNHTAPVMAKRNDHTATLWGTNKLVVFGGTGDDDDHHFFNTVAILHLDTMTWEHPETTGMIPTEGRIKHSANIDDQGRLYIAGGLDREDHVADTVLILDLNTYEWQPPLHFVQRTQHMTFFYNKRLYLFGGYHQDMSRSNILSFLDLDTHTVTQLEIDSPSAPPLVGEQFAQICGDQMVVVVATTPSTCTLTTQQNDDDDDDDDDDEVSDNNNHNNDINIAQHSSSRRRRRRNNDHAGGTGGGSIGLWNLDLSSMQWQYHDVSPQLSMGCIHWQYFAMAEHASSFILFGATDEEVDEYYTMMLRIQLKDHGIVPVPPSQLGTDLAGLLTMGQSSSADFMIRSSINPEAGDLHVHRLVLLARWPHFSHLMNSGMVESLCDRMTLPEPFDVLKAFVQFLYTDALNETLSPVLVADLMVMANLYLLPRLLALCVRRLYGCIMVEYVSKIYQAAVDAGQEGLQQTAVMFIFRHFGLVTRTSGFRMLSPFIMSRLLDQIPFFSSVVVAPSPSSTSLSSSLNHPSINDPTSRDILTRRSVSPMEG